MKLVPWRKREVGRPLSGLQQEMNRLFENFFGDTFVEPFGGAGEWSPALDVAETEGAFLVRAELPGLDPDNVEITLTGDTLTIKGEKKEEKEEKTKSFHRVERSYGSFQRSVQLPVSVKADAVAATFKNGVLTIELPKVEEAKTKSVKIKAK